ncbi:MAG: metallophosphoesterase [Desulfurococcales archaeon]|nr:metallophosphoesterase [Desulfurococcales archaeon]
MGRLSGDGTIVAPRPCSHGVYGVSDIHSPRYLNILEKALEDAEDLEVVLLAGDLVDKGRHIWIKPVIRQILNINPSAKMIAVFGNEEYDEVKEELRKFNEVLWLDDSYTIIEHKGCRIGIIGSTGALDRLTRWQRRHKPWLLKVYRERPGIIKKLYNEVKDMVDRVIIMTHYGSARGTLIGEPRRIWPELYSSAMEKLLSELKPDAAVHGHAHNGTPKTLVNGVPVYNVALPLNKRLTRIKFRPKLHGLFQH